MTRPASLYDEAQISFATESGSPRIFESHNLLASHEPAALELIMKAFACNDVAVYGVTPPYDENGEIITSEDETGAEGYALWKLPVNQEYSRTYIERGGMDGECFRGFFSAELAKCAVERTVASSPSPEWGAFAEVVGALPSWLPELGWIFFRVCDGGAIGVLLASASRQSEFDRAADSLKLSGLYRGEVAVVGDRYVWRGPTLVQESVYASMRNVSLLPPDAVAEP